MGKAERDLLALLQVAEDPKARTADQVRCAEGPTPVALRLASNPRLVLNAVGVLETRPEVEILARLLQRGYWSETLVKNALTNPEPLARAVLAQVATDTDILTQLARDPSAWVRRKVVANPSCPAEALLVASQTTDGTMNTGSRSPKPTPPERCLQRSTLG